MHGYTAGRGTTRLSSLLHNVRNCVVTDDIIMVFRRETYHEYLAVAFIPEVNYSLFFLNKKNGFFFPLAMAASSAKKENPKGVRGSPGKVRRTLIL